MAPVDDANRVHIFDTTLRDGEQSPGISLNTAREGRDRPAAGPPGGRRDRGRLPDHLARRLRGGRGDRPRRRGPGDLRPGPHPQGRHRRRLGGDQGRRTAAHPHLHLDLRHPHRAPAADRPRGRQGPGQGGRRPGQVLLRGRRVLADGRDPRRHRVHRRGLRDRGRGGRDRDQRPRHGRLHDARGVRGVLAAPVRAGAGAATRSRPRSTATTTWAWPSPTPTPACWQERGRSSAPSTASASAPATARWRRSRCWSRCARTYTA